MADTGGWAVTQQASPGQPAAQQSVPPAAATTGPLTSSTAVAGSAARQRAAGHPVQPRRWSLRARLIVSRRRMSQDAARRRAESELSDARWRAGIADAMLALQHEINNPLSALLGNAELMMMELKDKGERNEMLEVIHEQAMRIADVVKRLRQLKNPESVDYVGGSRMVDVWNERSV